MGVNQQCKLKVLRCVKLGFRMTSRRGTFNVILGNFFFLTIDVRFWRLFLIRLIVGIGFLSWISDVVQIESIDRNVTFDVVSSVDAGVSVQSSIYFPTSANAAAFQHHQRSANVFSGMLTRFIGPEKK